MVGREVVPTHGMASLCEGACILVKEDLLAAGGVGMECANVQDLLCNIGGDRDDRAAALVGNPASAAVPSGRIAVLSS